MDWKILIPLKQPGEKIYVNEHGNFVAEWYEYPADDNDAMADSAGMLVVDDARLAALVAHLGLPSDVDRQGIAEVLAERFD